MKLLSRTEFRNNVLSRNRAQCCVPECNQQAVDAHHIFNRNLFTQEHEKGGYFLENGAQLCSSHHYQAEATHITTLNLWEWCNILTPVFPTQLDPFYEYDAWGNRTINEWSRTPGPLFHDAGFQKLLARENLSWLFQESR